MTKSNNIPNANVTWFEVTVNTLTTFKVRTQQLPSPKHVIQGRFI